MSECLVRPVVRLRVLPVSCTQQAALEAGNTRVMQKDFGYNTVSPLLTFVPGQSSRAFSDVCTQIQL